MRRRGEREGGRGPRGKHQRKGGTVLIVSRAFLPPTAPLLPLFRPLCACFSSAPFFTRARISPATYHHHQRAASGEHASKEAAADQNRMEKQEKNWKDISHSGAFAFAFAFLLLLILFRFRPCAPLAHRHGRACVRLFCRSVCGCQPPSHRHINLSGLMKMNVLSPLSLFIERVPPLWSIR